MSRVPKNMDEYGRVWRGKNPDSGTALSVYHSESAGMDYSDGTKYSAVCEDHGCIMGETSISGAKSAALDSVSWCPDCQEASDTLKGHFQRGHDGAKE